MSKVINLFGNDTETALRNIADMIKDGEIPNDNATIIIGTDVYQTGNVPIEQAVMESIFNMNMGIHKLMKPIFESGD